MIWRSRWQIGSNGFYTWNCNRLCRIFLLAYYHGSHALCLSDHNVARATPEDRCTLGDLFHWPGNPTRRFCTHQGLDNRRVLENNSLIHYSIIYAKYYIFSQRYNVKLLYNIVNAIYWNVVNWITVDNIGVFCIEILNSPPPPFFCPQYIL